MHGEFGRLWFWLLPKLAAALVAASLVFGLVTASQATDRGTYIAGFVLAGLALLALGWGWVSYLDGHDRGLPIPVLVEGAGALQILIGALGALAVAGLVGASLALLALELKHYFDCQDRN
jgi:hypothetical protein